MPSLREFPDGVCGLTAQAVHALTRRFCFVAGLTAERNSASIGLKSLAGNPSAFPACRCHPHSGYASLMPYAQGPLGAQLEDVIIRNGYRGEWIHHYQPIFKEADFRPNPEKVSRSRNNQAEHELTDHGSPLRLRHDAVGCKETHEQPRRYSPSKIRFGLKDSYHSPIISGDMQ